MGFGEEVVQTPERGFATPARPDFFRLGVGRGIIAEVERGCTVNNNHHLEDIWKAHAARDAQLLVLIAPSYNFKVEGSPREKLFVRVVHGAVSFFGDPRRELDIVRLHVFGYGWSSWWLSPTWDCLSICAALGVDGLGICTVAGVRRNASCRVVAVVSQVVAHLHLRGEGQHFPQQRRQEPFQTAQFDPVGCGLLDHRLSQVREVRFRGRGGQIPFGLRSLTLFLRFRDVCRVQPTAPSRGGHANPIAQSSLRTLIWAMPVALVAMPTYLDQTAIAIK